MRQIHYFNPETDYALASDLSNYTPPASIVKIRKKLSLLPALYAEKGDCILVDCLDSSIYDSPYNELVKLKGLDIITPDNLHSNNDKAFIPWGWNKSLRRFLVSHGFENGSIPSAEELSKRRMLSHRSVTISFINEYNKLSGNSIPLPKEFSETDEAISFCSANPGCYLKAPWSSSGRGIMATASSRESIIRQWTAGIIRSQGSVMAETGYDRHLDFASEWECRDGKAIFSGFSVFSTSARGGYHYNNLLPQTKLEKIIKRTIDSDLDLCVEYQRQILDQLISPFYDGPIGIDMLSTTDRRLVPCIELNLRNTMGMVAREIVKQRENDDEISDCLRRLYPDSIFYPLG